MRYELLKYEYEYADAGPEYCAREDLSRLERYKEKAIFRAHSGVLKALSYLTIAHLEFPSQKEGIEYCISMGVKITKAYFFSDWVIKRYDVQPAESYPHGDIEYSYYYFIDSWFDTVRHGMLCAFLGSDFDSVVEIAGYVRHKMEFESGIDELNKEDNYYTILFCHLLCGRECSLEEEYISKIESCRHKRPKLLLECYRAVRQKNSEAFGTALKAYLKRYLKAELKHEMIAEYISLDGSLLWHLAKQYEMELPELPEKEAALIISRETLKLE